MGRELQKRKRRSSRAVVKQPSSKSKRLMFPLGNSIVAQNWCVNLSPVPCTLKFPPGKLDHLKDKRKG